MLHFLIDGLYVFLSAYSRKGIVWLAVLHKVYKNRVKRIGENLVAAKWSQDTYKNGINFISIIIISLVRDEYIV